MLISKRRSLGGRSPPFVVSVLHILHTPTAFGCFAQTLFTQFRLCVNSVTTLQAIACTTDGYDFFDDMFAIEKALKCCYAARFTLHLVPDSLFHHYGFGGKSPRDKSLGYASHHSEIGGANCSGPRDHDIVVSLDHYSCAHMGLSISHFFFQMRIYILRSPAEGYFF